MNNDYDLLIKCSIVGDIGVGKSSILNSYLNCYDPQKKPTIGVEFSTVIVKSKESIRVKLQVWDPSGLEVYKSLTESFLKDSKVVIIVYDVSNVNSFQNTMRWYEFMKLNSPDANYYIVGNKCDLKSGISTAKEPKFDNEVKFMDISCKKVYTIKKLFKLIANDLTKDLPIEILPSSPTQNLQTQSSHSLIGNRHCSIL